ncbi:MAG: DUF4276 family protein [Candidatus Riflebacteria bacterium]|nr:DUF4276 family protein [Candidatus Riflebacteria bacterium]
MKRIHIICEGQTEETFVKDILAPEFSAQGVELRPSLIGKPGHKGGNVRIERLVTDVRNRLLSDKDAYCTTFFDYYGLPTGFPGKIEAAQIASPFKKSELMCNALREHISSKVGENATLRFIPYVQMYEFEALLFSDPEKMALSLNRKDLAPSFSDIRKAFPSPEDINDSPITAPSKRIISFVGEYEKPLMGVLTALEIGLSSIRAECPLFNAWLNRLLEVAKC